MYNTFRAWLAAPSTLVLEAAIEPRGRWLGQIKQRQIPQEDLRVSQLAHYLGIKKLRFKDPWSNPIHFGPSNPKLKVPQLLKFSDFDGIQHVTESRKR